MLTWNFNNKIGEWKEVEREKEYSYNIYQCNGLAVILYEYSENGKELYQMHSFFVDKDHLKNMLGLNKKNGFNENYYFNTLKEIKVLKQCKEMDIILSHIIKARFKNEVKIILSGEAPF